MDSDAGPQRAGDRFPLTRRSIVAAAGDADPEVRRQAWDVLVASYWRPVYKVLRMRWRLDREDAEDATQEFFASALVKGTFERYDSTKARFRTYLRTCLDGFAANERKAASGTPYEVIETLGRGGMGTVYLAHDCRLDREVALKVVQLPEGTGDLDRLLLEARVLARLEHPGIVPVHDAGLLPDGRAFYAMKHVRGYGLDEYARTAPLPERLRAFERICEAVAFAHAHGVIHRDLKPENVMVGPFGEVLVMDWGVAKVRPHPPAPSPAPAQPPTPGEGEPVGAVLPVSLFSRRGGWEGAGEEGRGDEGLGREGHSTAHGTILGTPGYMAPEQARGDVARIDERTDVWALGAILGFLLEGEEPPPRPLAAIRRRAMADEPGERYPKVKALAADLALYFAGLPVGAHREGWLERIARFARRYRTPILLILAYLLMRVLLIFFLGR